MRSKILSLSIAVVFYWLATGGPSLSHAGEDTPVSRDVVAVVNGEEIYMDDLEHAVAARHRDMSETTSVAWLGYEDILDRLIDSRLVIQEAMDTGLSDRSVIREKVGKFADSTLVKMAKGRIVRGVQADEDKIEEIYREDVRRWKFKAVSFSDMEQASGFRSEMLEGKDFEKTAEVYVQGGKAAWEGGDREVREVEIAPEISAAFVDQVPGYVTQVIQAAGRLYIFKLTDVSYPDDASVRQNAIRKALARKRKEVVDEHTDELLKKFVAVDRDVLSTIGDGDHPEIAEDTRIVARVGGEEPVQVADLIEHLQGEYYHGGKDEEHRQTLLKDPESVLKDSLEKRLYLKEAHDLGLNTDEQYTRAVADYERSLVFGMYLEEFLVPQARLTEEETKAAYEARADEFMMPQTVRVESLIFDGEDSARKALASINSGTDLKWLIRNTSGLKGDGTASEVLPLDSLPEDVQENLAGAKVGDAGLLDLENGTYKMFIIREFPPRTREPLEKIRPIVAREMFNERLNQVIQDLVSELRELSEIVVYKEKLNKGALPKAREAH